jgi:hypothetical protein
MRKVATYHCLVAGICLLLAAQVAAQDAKGHFPDTDLLETEFKRGVSSEADIVARLGEPTGRGDYLLPPDYEPREILYYEYIKTGKVDAVSSMLQIAMQQKILAVFILAGKFDGFMWYTTDEFTAEGKGDAGPVIR